jgi:REP element-mobilizing transposase RayT
MSHPPRRKKLRLPDFDYAAPGAYFVTICTQKRRLLLDATPVREMIRAWWDRLPAKFPNAEIDEFVIMPNHIHGIIILHDAAAADDVRADDVRADDVRADDVRADDVRADRRVGPESTIRPVVPLPRIIQWFKTMTTNEYIRGVRNLGWESFPGKLWQRNYYEHVIRNDREWNAIRHYIQENPARWAHDLQNPTRPGRAALPKIASRS